MFMDNLKSTMENESNISVTENGAVGYRTTGKALLDLNFAIASLRQAKDSDIINRFEMAYAEDKNLAMKWLFYARDIRGGVGERRLFRVILKHMVNDHYAEIKHLIPLVAEYGRWDDLWVLLTTKAKNQVASIIKEQLAEDLSHMRNKQPVSLLAKWLPSAKGNKSKSAEKNARLILELIGMTRKEYNRTLSKLRKYLKIVERDMCANRWETINYEAVPSRANLIYNSAFLRHDESRRRNFLSAVNRGEKKINSSTLFPHDIVYQYNSYYKEDAGIEALWKALPDTVKGCGNTIVVADGSGSMSWGHPDPKSRVSALHIANALAIYFAERSSGQFKDKYITFSRHPQLVDLSKGKSLKDKIKIAERYDECDNTNIEAVFDLILKTAVQNHMEQKDLPKNILIVSDMEFDTCAESNMDSLNCRRKGSSNNLFKEIEKRYVAAGYKIPRMVFWNVCSRTGTIPVKENDLGVALVSGFSVNIVKMVMSNKTDPFECLVETLMSERYAQITVKNQSTTKVKVVKKK